MTSINSIKRGQTTLTHHSSTERPESRIFMESSVSGSRQQSRKQRRTPHILPSVIEKTKFRMRLAVDHLTPAAVGMITRFNPDGPESANYGDLSPPSTANWKSLPGTANLSRPGTFGGTIGLGGIPSGGTSVPITVYNGSYSATPTHRQALGEGHCIVHVTEPIGGFAAGDPLPSMQMETTAPLLIDNKRRVSRGESQTVSDIMASDSDTPHLQSQTTPSRPRRSTTFCSRTVEVSPIAAALSAASRAPVSNKPYFEFPSLTRLRQLQRMSARRGRLRVAEAAPVTEEKEPQKEEEDDVALFPARKDSDVLPLKKEATLPRMEEAQHEVRLSTTTNPSLFQSRPVTQQQQFDTMRQAMLGKRGRTPLGGPPPVALPPPSRGGASLFDGPSASVWGRVSVDHFYFCERIASPEPRSRSSMY